MKYLLLTGTLKSGIGQVMSRYKQMLEHKGYETTLRLYSDAPSSDTFDVGFAFLLPLPQMIISSENHLRNCKRIVRMTVCETETVHESYGIFLKYPLIHVPSMFALNILRRQFPTMKLALLRHWAESPPILKTPRESRPYTFYTIGNVIDFRKNINTLVNVFVNCRFPNAKLVLKATCNRDVKIDAPNVYIINGLLSDSELNKIHDMCDCYVNCSHSEGVGMGCVEAAMRNKPIILSEYGGATEYVHTPWVIPCKPTPVGRDEFLFKKDMIWGHPDPIVLTKYMHHCYDNTVSHYDHSYTHNIMKDLHI